MKLELLAGRLDAGGRAASVKSGAPANDGKKNSHSRLFFIIGRRGVLGATVRAGGGWGERCRDGSRNAESKG